MAAAAAVLNWFARRRQHNGDAPPPAAGGGQRVPDDHHHRRRGGNDIARSRSLRAYAATYMTMGGTLLLVLGAAVRGGGARPRHRGGPCRRRVPAVVGGDCPPDALLPRPALRGGRSAPRARSAYSELSAVQPCTTKTVHF